MASGIELIQAIQVEKEARRTEQQEKRLVSAERRAAAMEPLFNLLRDLEAHYIPVPVMRQLWPDGFDRRDDRAASLILGYLMEEGFRCGVKLRTLTGTKTFETEIRNTGDVAFLYTNDSAAFQPVTREFANQNDWLNLFLREMADVVDPKVMPW
jgi:hypothetical protein